MDLAITGSVYNRMVEAARKAVPNEACGLLGGVDGVASMFYELRNADESNEHYTMLPEEQFAAVKEMRADGKRMLAIWHSHPETPARMSEEDLRLAFTPDVIYVIVSLADEAGVSVGGFIVEDGVSSRIEVNLDDTI
jgi:proteasome lid subunit RPN8/RPN11